MAVFSAGTLVAKDIDRAFPIISAGAPDLTLSAWRCFAGRLLANLPASADADMWPIAGIVAARSTDSYLHGLFCYRVIEDLRAGPTVCAHEFVALGLLHRSETVSTLMTALEAIAISHGCAHMHVHLPEARVVALTPRDATPLDGDGSLLKTL